MAGPVCLFAGAAASFNVRRLVANLGWMLSPSVEVHLVSTATETSTAAKRDGVQVFGTDRNRSLRGSVAALRAYLADLDPAVLAQLTRPPIHGTIVGPFAARHGVPFVYRYGGDRFYSYRVGTGIEPVVHFGLNNLLGRVPLRLADRCIVLGPTGRRRLTERGVDPDRIAVLPPSIDGDRFAEPNAKADLPGVPDDRHVALIVGRRSRRKGLETMERVIPSVLERRDDLQFVFVGGGDREPSVPPAVRSHVTVVGPVSPAEMPAYYQRADVLVHPSLNEGLPRAILEALASCTPVVARDVGDVAAATDNLFVEDSELVEQLCEFESLALDDWTRFSRSTLRPAYVEFFQQFG